ncbi:hypothetical protein PRIPAC_74166 [Pristionchus pacificus]|uniref:Uncharacterized protein n=1 Tax=Pristionchus pacificus TaxID=54126 RepID=A0A2A6CFS5_PRIPA|nr:hypothetical protein PRIPAC_74166 [Pristionchus pacificus]|eukprot:PDM76989.1 hypothetical protein PRIPAC_42384 [Pristionchus pacificus]
MAKGQLMDVQDQKRMSRPPFWPTNLTLGYSKELFPAFFVDKLDQYTGTLLQLWNEIQLTTIGVEYIDKDRVRKYDFDFDLDDGVTDKFEGIFEAIQEGEVLSCINGLSLETPSLIKSFRYSNPVFYQTLSFFLVFWPDELTLIILCAIAITIVNVVAKRTTVKNSLCAFFLSLSRFVIFPVALTFLFIIYSAAFRGNMVIPYVSPVVTFSDMLNNLRLGKWSLMTTIALTDEEDAAFYYATNGAAVETVESANRMMRACTSDHIVIRIFDMERAIQLTTDEMCTMEKITPSTNGRYEQLRVMLTQNGDTLPYFLLFSRKRTSRRVVDYVNYALRMFSEDQMDRFWNVRFMREKGGISLAALKRYKTMPPELHRYDPITLLQISPVFGLAITSIGHCHLHRRLSVAIKKKRMITGEWVVPHDRLSGVFDSCLLSIVLVGVPLTFVYCRLRRERNRWERKDITGDGGFEKSDSFDYYPINSIGIGKATGV